MCADIAGTVRHSICASPGRCGEFYSTDRLRFQSGSYSGNTSSDAPHVTQRLDITANTPQGEIRFEGHAIEVGFLAKFESTVHASQFKEALFTALRELVNEYSEIEGTPYQSDVWVMGRVAEFIAHTNSVETARAFYRPILELGPAAKYWVEDFLQSWIALGLEVSPDLQGFGKIWEDTVAYTETLPSWQPGEG
jgi:hypothetical protein